MGAARSVNSYNNDVIEQALSMKNPNDEAYDMHEKYYDTIRLQDFLNKNVLLFMRHYLSTKESRDIFINFIKREIDSFDENLYIFIKETDLKISDA